MKNLHPRVGIVHPIDRNFTDTKAEALRRDEELGVEEPLVVLDQREQLERGLAAQRLEPALGIGESTAHGEFEQQVVGARDQLALGAPHDMGASSQSGADGHIALARKERSHQREQRRQRSGEIDIHIGDDRSGAARPGRAQRVPSPLAREVDGDDARKGARQLGGDGKRVIGAGVVHHGDQSTERERMVEEMAKLGDASFELRGFVVHRHHDLDIQRNVAGAGPRFGRCQDCHVGIMSLRLHESVGTRCAFDVNADSAW